MLGVIHDRSEMVDYFLHNVLPSNPIIDAQDRTGNTALHYAIRMNKEDMMNILLDNYADCNLQDHDGYTPLMLAVLNQDSNQIRMLILHGADPKTVNKQGQTAADITHTLPASALREQILQMVQPAAVAKTVKTDTSPTTTVSSSRTSPLAVNTGLDTSINVKNKAPLSPSSASSLEYSPTSSYATSEKSSDIHSTDFMNASSRYKKNYSDQKEDDESPSPIKPPSPK